MERVGKIEKEKWCSKDSSKQLFIDIDEDKENWQHHQDGYI